MLRREFMKSITGGLAAIVVSPSIAEKESIDPDYGTWVYRNLNDPHGNRSFWHPVFKASGYWGDGIGMDWLKFSDEMLSDKEWYDFIRKYQIVRKVINGSEVVKDDELSKMKIQELVHTLYRVSVYLRYHGISDKLIESAIKPI